MKFFKLLKREIPCDSYKTPTFEKDFYKLQKEDKERFKSLCKHMDRIIWDPECGKPHGNIRFGFRELYDAGKSYRLEYIYDKNKDFVTFTSYYHKK